MWRCHVSSKRALVIDEDVEVRRILREKLSSADWWVDDAPDGLGGLQKIQDARDFGEGYSCIITEAFLTDFDGKPFLKTLRLQYSGVNLVVMTGYGDEEREELVRRLMPAIYVKKPVDITSLATAMDGFDLSANTAAPAPAPDPVPYEDKVGAYLFLQVGFQHIEATVSALKEQKGVLSTNAVHAPDLNLILRVALPTTADLKELLTAVGAIPSVKLVGHEVIGEPQLSRGMDEFVRHYQPVKEAANVDFVAGVDTNVYLFIDIDRYQIERIYMSLLLTIGVIRCRVISGGNKLVVLASGAIQPNVTRHLLGKLAEMDGVKRVREARVINIGN